MRVLFDGVVFQNSYQRGIQRVFRELINHLNVESRLVLADRPKAELPTRGEIRSLRVPGARLLPRRTRRRLQPILGAPGFRAAARGCDIFHSTYFTGPPIDMPSVVHVHDMITERFTDLFQTKAAEEEIERKRGAIQSASAIIAISHATARELVHFYPQTEGKITVSHLGADHLARVDAATASAAPEKSRYALYVGDRALYKNFSVILDALETDRWPAELGLVVVGSPWRAGEKLRVERLSTTRRVHHAGRVDERELARLYQAAACVLVPSLAEGFGLPVLEAQAAGTPVVCSDITVFHEVAGEAAVFFDPHRPEALADAVARVLEPSVRPRLLELGGENLKRFSWSACARQTEAVYAQLCGERPL